ncbi:MAG: hypothetical protein IKL44_05060 [Clostridia bacterium]|nr:hypothetical protein [Clostridia bacterium]
MKKLLFPIFAILLLLCGCANEAVTSSLPEGQDDTMFTQCENGNLLSSTGTEYTFLAMEYDLIFLGEIDEDGFLGGVKGEESIPTYEDDLYKFGLYSLKNDDTHNIIIRDFPDNEWCGIYRKASLPELDVSIDNVSRLELILEKDGIEPHKTCGNGITDADEIKKFITDIQKQPSAEEAGLYDSVRGPDGFLHNCFLWAGVYCFFEDEPDVAIKFDVTSYNNKAYSLLNGDTEYVLPDEWIQKLEKKN